MSDRRPTLADVINRALEMGLRDLYTTIPAKVVKWEGLKGRADCQILIKNVTEGEDGSRQVVSWPVVPGVPVAFFGAGGFRATCPIEDGTTGSLHFSHRSLDKWLTGSGAEVDPELDHDHGLADAIFIPGLRPFGSPWRSVPTSSMSVGHDSGTGVIDLAESIVGLGGPNASDFLIKGTTYKAAHDTLVAALKTFVDAIVDTTGAPSAAKTVMKAAIDAFTSATANALSTVSKTL